MSNFLAHNENANGAPHLLHEHLRCVGRLAQQFAAEGHPMLAMVAEWSGLLHDLGKYRAEFQEYLRGQRQSSYETHHAVYGAALAAQYRKLAMAFVIAAHHAGLHDIDDLQELIRSQKYNASDCLPDLVAKFESEVCKLNFDFKEPTFDGDKLRFEMFVRMLFSSLVDADFLDTEQHFTLQPRAMPALQPDELFAQLLAEKNAKSTAGELNQLRHRIFQQCVDAATKPRGFFSLTVPTGGGKTLAGMAFALAHARQHHLRRVIVVIPYLSIIEQNAAQYQRIFDPQRTGIVIEHHSAVNDPPSDTNEERSPTKSPFEYATENWDAPIIVTTSVQFIESLFAAKTSKCRKLHNIANSVVIFDEVQTLPSHLLEPLLNVLKILQRDYGVSFVFSTATQPAFRQSNAIKNGFAENEITEITEDTEATFAQLQRVNFHFAKPGTTESWAAIAEKMTAQQQALCIVNTRRHARELYEEVGRQSFAPSSVFHLSSLMCAQHRFDILEMEIRVRLREQQRCHVVSTQLIEAGVDVDFPVVYRALAPLDSIVQAAGRCNREGKLTRGEVFLFHPEQNTLPKGFYSTATNITAMLLQQITEQQLAADHEIFARYFTQLYQYAETDAKQIQQLRREFKFRSTSKEAKVIEDNTRAVIVHYGKSSDFIEDIRTRPVFKEQARFTKTDLRRLQRYFVNLYQHQFDHLQALGQIQPLLPNLELFVLSEGFYDDHFGIVIEERPTEDFIL
jgi:CRISPR-associated endonuclease/helicase Cas3